MKRALFFIVITMTLLIPNVRISGGFELTFENKAFASYESRVGEQIDIYGITAPFKKVDIAAKAAGTIEYLNFSEGSKVNAGDTLFKIDGSDYELQVKLSKTQVEKANIELCKAVSDFNRIEALYQSKYTTRQNFDNARFTVGAARANLNTAEANLRIAQTALSNTLVKSPICGVISVKHKEKGDFIDKGRPVVEIMDINTIKAKFKIPEHALNSIKKGNILDVSIDAYPAENFSAEIYEIKPVGDWQTHFFEISALISNPDQKIKTGMFLKSKIILDNNSQKNYSILRINNNNY